MKCKYNTKAKIGDTYIKCGRDGSIRKKGCPCAKYKPTFWEYIKEYFKG